MDPQQNKNTKQLDIKNAYPQHLGVILSAPVILTTVILLALAYIADIMFAGVSELGIGETSKFSRLLFDSGTLLSKLIYPLISTGIAAVYGGFSAIPSGLLGGMLAGMGATFESINANATSISGIFGCIFAGFAAVYSVRILNKIIIKTKRIDETTGFFLLPVISLVLTLSAVLMLNTAAGFTNHIASSLAGICSKTNGILLSVILGIFMTVDCGGPLYLAGYVFGVASIATGEPGNMATVAAAGAIPPLTMGLYTIIYKERARGYDRILGVAGILAGLMGLPHPALAFYTQKHYRFLIACVPGGIIAATLSYAFNCSSEAPAGGILGFQNSGKPLFFLVSLICGALLSTFILSLTESEEYDSSTQDKRNLVEEAKGLAPQI